jgi:MFS family permease
MAEGRISPARERSESPVLSAGLSASETPVAPRGRWRAFAARLTRPPIEVAALESYRHERRTELGMPIVGALMEGGFVGVIALALITAAPMFGLLSSVLWARIALGRRKVPLITSLMAAFVVITAAVALLPETPVGGWLLAALVIGARLVLGGTITIRSLVWTLNYPREARGRVTSRLQFLTVLVMTTTSVVGGFLLNADPQSFRIVYTVGAFLATLGVLAFSRVRVIGEEAQLAKERAEATEAGITPVGPGSAWSVLRDDPLFARYQACQFTIGVSNMMIEAPLIYLVSRELQASYATSIALTLAIPLGVSLLTLPFWAAYIDRVHIAEFRAWHSWIWVVAQLFTWVGAMAGSLLWIGFGRFLLGMGRGGGSLAWQLGHNDFARPENVGLYMGVHVTLTGLRGAFAPFMGMLLYVGWSQLTIPVLGVRLPPFEGIGAHAIGLACVLGALGSLGYWRLHRRIAKG